MDELLYRQIDWEQDSERLRELFRTAWNHHPVLKKPYFDWQFRTGRKSKAMGFCAVPKGKEFLLAGVYLVLPTTVVMDEKRLSFSTSLFTITHPDYYKRGIFRDLASLTFAKCRELGIVGTIGVPNRNSVDGFTKHLGFEILGRFEVVAKLASPYSPHAGKVCVREVSSFEDIAEMNVAIARNKAVSGVVLGDRTSSFLKWRFLDCPGVDYRIFVVTDENRCVRGLSVIRRATKRHVRLTVIVEFVIDNDWEGKEDVAEALLAVVNRCAWRSFAPLVIALANSHSPEARFLVREGFKPLPKSVLPHGSPFIIKLHDDLPQDVSETLLDFQSWHFSFADYDIF